MKKKAIVLLSGGQDSTTCLYWAKKNYDEIEGIFFHYSQKHEIEYECAKDIAKKTSVNLHEFTIPAFKKIGGSSLTNDIKMDDSSKKIPNTFVPGRNIIFLSYASAVAYKSKITDIIIGVNEEDYSGYPDCRGDFINSMEKSLQLGFEKDINIITPLQELSKAGIWKLSDELGVIDIIKKDTHTCYNGDRTTLHDWGYGCGECPSCLLRKKGYEEFLMFDV
ncbi:MAG: 7-cyano-7-deazaguanine synthase QueC [Candidatus Marinimicrobia bacterium]|nr:7-cyano-7-deazaguanine synthase QueC [Candidatus Neomarinimicrobiota bacterium]